MSKIGLIKIKNMKLFENYKLKIMNHLLKIRNCKLKIVFFALILFLLMANNADAATLSKAPNNLGLVGYWTFNEGTSTVALDYSGNKNKGTLVNGPTWVNGKFGKALNFDGVNDYVTQGLSLAQSQGTIAHWVKPDQLRVMAIYYESDGTTAGQYNGFNDPTSMLEMHTGIDGSNNWYAQYQRGTNVSPNGFASVGAGSVNAGQWSHVVMTWNTSGSLILYVNGIQVGADNMSGETFVSKTATVKQIGRVGDGTAARHWDGLIDEVRVYNRALSANEVQQLYNTGR